MSLIHEILKKYWGYDSFREKQEAIINAALSKQDTLALLPTGGGKSICFQVPGMVMEGITLVISPLIALMHDQVEGLKAKGIKAVAITSGMSQKQIDIVLDNAVYGETKFLYVSPERLKTRLFLARFEKMNIGLIAVDEAHCISQWGYDFRPSYLQIAEIRKLKPTVPILALTATATPDVVEDIQKRLEFPTANVIQKSFNRPNLTYSTHQTINKLNRIKEYVRATKGSGVIYCSTRRKVKEVCKYLLEIGESADFYHGGLDMETRSLKQKAWINDQTRIIVSTNAFGMGIDKPDVRFVLHYDIPESIEAYFQEAGRAGRDEKAAEAHMFFEANDILDLQEKFSLKFPGVETIKNVYKALGNFFQLAVGAGEGETFDIDMLAFCDQFNLNLITVYNSLKFLELEGFLTLSEGIESMSQIKIKVNNFDLYQYQVRDKEFNQVIQFILRTQMGVFDDFVKIDEGKIAAKTKLPNKRIVEILHHLEKEDVIDYFPRTNKPRITFLTERLPISNLYISPLYYHDRKVIAENKLNAMLSYLNADTICRNVYLLEYFGDTNGKPCGKCNSCLTTSQNEINPDLYRSILDDFKKEGLQYWPLEDIMLKYPEIAKDDLINCLRWMDDHKMIKLNFKGTKIGVIRT